MKYKIRERFWYIGVTALSFSVNFFLDRITKYLARLYLKDMPPRTFLNNSIVLMYAENDGAFLSLGADWNIYVKYIALLIIPIALCAALLLYLMIKERRLYRVVIGSCIIGGGLSNLIDRLFNGFRVVDFLNFGAGPLRTGVLNTADMSVTFGVIALFIMEHIVSRRTRS
jgi:signal peptidase II